MITTDEVRRAYEQTKLTPVIGGYINPDEMSAHPLGAIAFQRGIPMKDLYEYFGPNYVDDFNVGFFDLRPSLAYDADTYEFGYSIRESILNGSLLQPVAADASA